MYELYGRDANLTFELKDIYLIIAEKEKISSRKIKDNIVKAIRWAYMETEIDTMKKYFNFNEDKKPTPKLIISTILSKISGII